MADKRLEKRYADYFKVTRPYHARLLKELRRDEAKTKQARRR